LYASDEIIDSLDIVQYLKLIICISTITRADYVASMTR